MPQPRASLLQGTLDLLILKALSAGELHGLGVSRRIEQITGGTGLALSRAASARGIGLVDVDVGGVGEQPAGEVLHPHESR